MGTERGPENLQADGVPSGEGCSQAWAPAAPKPTFSPSLAPASPRAAPAPTCEHILAADHLVAVVFLSELAEGRLNDAASQTKHQVQGGLYRK